MEMVKYKELKKWIFDGAVMPVTIVLVILIWKIFLNLVFGVPL